MSILDISIMKECIEVNKRRHNNLSDIIERKTTKKCHLTLLQEQVYS